MVYMYMCTYTYVYIVYIYVYTVMHTYKCICYLCVCLCYIYFCLSVHFGGVTMKNMGKSITGAEALSQKLVISQVLIHGLPLESSVILEDVNLPGHCLYKWTARFKGQVCQTT